MIKQSWSIKFSALKMYIINLSLGTCRVTSIVIPHTVRIIHVSWKEKKPLQTFLILSVCDKDSKSSFKYSKKKDVDKMLEFMSSTYLFSVVEEAFNRQ